MAAPATDSGSPTSDATPRLFRANEACVVLNCSRNALYDNARQQPERFGVIRLNERTLRFRRDRILAIARGEG